jgi:hypothetical protein
MQPVTSTCPSSTCLRRNLHDGATCTTHRRASASLQIRLGNPSQTCFHMMEAARSRHESRVNLPPLVLWRNRQTEACMVLRPKPRNRRGDFESQITKPDLTVLRPKPGETVASSFEVKLEKTIASSFEAKPEKTSTTSFEANPEKTATAGFEAKLPETITAGF